MPARPVNRLSTTASITHYTHPRSPCPQARSNPFAHPWRREFQQAWSNLWSRPTGPQLFSTHSRGAGVAASTAPSG